MERRVCMPQLSKHRVRLIFFQGVFSHDDNGVAIKNFFRTAGPITSHRVLEMIPVFGPEVMEHGGIEECRRRDNANSGQIGKPREAKIFGQRWKWHAGECN